jgi:hypothetical protein
MPFYLVHGQPKGTAATRIAIAGQVAADRGNTRGDLFIGSPIKPYPSAIPARRIERSISMRLSFQRPGATWW